MAPRRKCPFSGKAKKEQLKEKKLRNQGKNFTEKKPNLTLLKKSSDAESDDDAVGKTVKLNYQATSSKSKNQGRNRYALHFYKESKAEIEVQKKLASKSLEMVPEQELEVDVNNYFPPAMEIPRRPPWKFNMSREELDARENRYFTEFVNKMEKEFDSKNLGYFELNLETWRQLWRVLEMSDIILFIVDIRFAALMFPPSIYAYACNELKKNMILVLNKIDLAPPELVVAWKHYFLKNYPTLKVLTFTSYPSYNLRSNTDNKEGLQVRRRKGKLKMAAEGAQMLFEACKEITQGHVDLTSWADKITEEMNNTYDDGEEVQVNVKVQAVDTGYEEHIRYKGGMLTIGCIGQPNVGKSSLMNAIMGKKVVSVSRTPGHTKHFQTIYLTKNVVLCDCPGLVFPSKTPRTLQILSGSYPIAQVREPYTAVKFLAERLDLPKLLKIQHPECDDNWSAMDVCEAWARKRGFFTAKASRPDTYRAANSLLRMSLDGKICLCLKPPDYLAHHDEWLNHSDVAQVAWIQAKGKEGRDKGNSDDEGEVSSESEEELKKTGNNSSSDDDEGKQESGPPLVSNRFLLLQGSED